MSIKKTYLLIFIFLAGVLGLYLFNKYKVTPNINFSKLELLDENSKNYNFDSLKGKKIIVSFYASWCPDCLKELKTLNEVKNEKLKDVTVLAITDESMEKLQAFKIKKMYPFTFLKLTKSFNDIRIFSIPTVYVLNTKGAIVYEHVGYVNWKDESTLNHLKSLMQ